MKKLFLLSWLVLLLGLGKSAYGAVINGDFETGSFVGWEVRIPWGVSEFEPYDRPAGTANVKGQFSWYDLTSSSWENRVPLTSDYFAVIGTGDEWFDIGQGSFDVSVRQTVSMSAGSLLTGQSFFYNGDYEAQDSAWVRIYDSFGREIATPWLELSGSFGAGDPNSVPYGSATSWVQWNWETLTAGDYTLALGVTTFGDNRFRSYGIFDSIQVVPEPGSLSLLALGLTSLLGARRLFKVHSRRGFQKLSKFL